MTSGSCSIAIAGIRVFAHHGVLPEEKEHGQDFIIDILLDLEAIPAADSLASTVDYAWAASTAVRIAKETACDLIETLAGEIASEMLSGTGVRRATVSVRKPDAPMPVPVESVGVTVTRQRPGTQGCPTGDDG
jgi:dihydroneopterin aldolase